VGDTIWYNGMATIEAKTRLVMERKLGGVMIWSLNHDGRGEQSLLGVIERGLKASE
jgi:chitinase